MARFSITKPPQWRNGQTIFNFLEFLRSKGVPTNQNARLADPFHLSDEDFMTYWSEFINANME